MAASFSASFSQITSTRAKMTAEFSGGDSNFEGYRYVLLEFDNGDSYQIRSTESGGGSSSFSRTISGLTPGTTYIWEATLGYQNASGGITWLSLSDNGSFKTKSDSVSLTPWSWDSSNGEATTAMTKNAYEMLMGNTAVGDFSHYVWNDLVSKVDAMRSAKGYSWDTAEGKYPSASGCKASSGETLSAKKYNGVRYNIGSVMSTDIFDVSPGDEVTGYHIVHLTDVLNDIIGSI